MLSNGGKVHHLCRACNSGEIIRTFSIEIPTLGLIMGLYNERDRFYFCTHCGNYAAWRSRLKASGKKPLPVVVAHPERFPSVRWHLNKEDIDRVPSTITYISYGSF